MQIQTVNIQTELNDGLPVSKYWWLLPKGELHSEVFRINRFLDTNQSYRNDEFLRYLNMYSNFEAMGMAATNYSRTSAASNKVNRVTYNVVQSCVDTATAKIAKNKVKPLFITSGGDAILQDKAKKLTKFVEGKFFETKFFERAPMAFKDGAVFGTGIMKIFREGAKIKIDRVLPAELKVDDAEAIYGEPRSMHQEKYVPREILRQEYPEFAEQLSMTAEAKPVQGRASIADQVCVIESWHLPTIKIVDGEPVYFNGRHSICVENCDLHDEEYKRERFPFVFIRWNQKLLGFHGQGIPEELSGIQYEINKLLRTIQLAMHLCSVPRFWLEAGSKVVKAHLNNQIGAIVSYVGSRPQLDNSNAVPPELREHLQYLVQLAFEKTGISQLSASSKKPDGLNSGKALREYDDIETERFVIVGQAWEQLHLDGATHMIELEREIFEEGLESSVQVKGKKFLETIKWKDIDLDEDEYLMQVFPTSMLSDTPSGRLSDIQDLMQAGMIDAQFGMKLLNLPDEEAYMNFMTAPLDNILMTIENLAQGDYKSPEPFQELSLGLKLVQYAYLMYKDDALPESRLELFRRWLSEANAILNPPPAEMPTPMDATAVNPLPNAVPQGRPEKAPVSPMMAMSAGQPGMPIG